jgi:SET domain-containing protein
LANLHPEVNQIIDDLYVIEKDKTVYIPETGPNGADISFFINHSKKPNVKTIDEGQTFITLRKIKKGEELTIDYGTYDHKY